MKKKYSIKEFFTEDQKAQIMEAIKKAEKETSGEIRVHLEARCKGDAYARAVKVFEKIGMTATEQRNGVLIFIALKDRKFAIIGDKGINEKTPPNFWDSISKKMGEDFKEDKYIEGIKTAILKVGEALSTYFPYEVHFNQDGTSEYIVDKNELSDDISF